MSTRAIIGSKKRGAGRYVHYDGYPSYLGIQLVRIVKRDGAEKAVETLVEQHYRWLEVDCGVIADKNDEEHVDGYGTLLEDDGRDDWALEGNWLTPNDNGDTEYAYMIDGDTGEIDVYGLIFGFEPARLLATVDALSNGAENEMRAL